MTVVGSPCLRIVGEDTVIVGVNADDKALIVNVETVVVFAGSRGADD